MHALELIKESVRGGEVWRTSLSKQREYIDRVPQVFAVVLFVSFHPLPSVGTGKL